MKETTVQVAVRGITCEVPCPVNTEEVKPGEPLTYIHVYIYVYI